MVSLANWFKHNSIIMTIININLPTINIFNNLFISKIKFSILLVDFLSIIKSSCQLSKVLLLLSLLLLLYCYRYYHYSSGSCRCQCRHDLQYWSYCFCVEVKRVVLVTTTIIMHHRQCMVNALVRLFARSYQRVVIKGAQSACSCHVNRALRETCIASILSHWASDAASTRKPHGWIPIVPHIHVHDAKLLLSPSLNHPHQLNTL